jgi:hypothetical protein
MSKKSQNKLQQLQWKEADCIKDGDELEEDLRINTNEKQVGNSQ